MDGQLSWHGGYDAHAPRTCRWLPQRRREASSKMPSPTPTQVPGSGTVPVILRVVVALSWSLPRNTSFAAVTVSLGLFVVMIPTRSPLALSEARMVAAFVGVPVKVSVVLQTRRRENR